MVNCVLQATVEYCMLSGMMRMMMGMTRIIIVTNKATSRILRRQIGSYYYYYYAICKFMLSPAYVLKESASLCFPTVSSGCTGTYVYVRHQIARNLNRSNWRQQVQYYNLSTSRKRDGFRLTIFWAQCNGHWGEKIFQFYYVALAQI